MQISNRQLFLNHIAQVSLKPMELEITRAKGIYLYDVNEKRFAKLVIDSEQKNKTRILDRIKYNRIIQTWKRDSVACENVKR